MAEEEEMLIDPPDPETTCTICYAEFLYPEDLEEHYTQMHKDRFAKSIVTCQFCPRNLPSVEEYVLHLRDHHFSSIQCCQYCLRAFTDNDEFLGHESKHIINKKTRKYSCSQCGKDFENTCDLETHEFEKHSNIKDGVFLNEYFPHISSVINMKAQLFLQLLGKPASYACQKCSYVCNDYSSYLQHLQTKNCVSVACETCANVFAAKCEIRTHLRFGCKEKDNREWRCKACQKIFKVKDFMSHKKNCSAVKCSICQIILNSMYDLTEHQAKAHPMAVLMKYCIFCSKEFVGSVALEKHMNRSHKKDFHLYKYKCLQCEKFFKHPKNLFGHYYSTHTDLKPYSCRICNKVFRLRRTFTIHIKMDHKSQGFVEFDENYHVFFTAQKSEKPFVPTSFFQNDDIVKEKETDVEKTDAEATDAEATVAETTVAETTDMETDIEKADQRKHPKMRFKKKGFNAQSDISKNEEQKRKASDKKNLTAVRKSKRIYNTVDEIPEDEPLSVVKKTRLKKQSNKDRFTCKICNKFCYTYQNYNHHVSMHNKKQKKECIKCSKKFLNAKELAKHMKKEHSSSRLTETLKSVLERRKSGIKKPEKQLSPQELFRRTIKRVKCFDKTEPAKIKEVSDKLSVQKFIENFTPEENKKPEVVINSTVTMKTVDKPIKKEPVIKLTKFIPPKENKNKVFKLAMPVRFKQTDEEPQKVRIRMVQKPVPVETFEDYNTQDDHIDYEDAIDDQDKDVPEAAHEVLLETEASETPKVLTQALVIPKLNKTPLEQLQIAHLMPEAPYFKIVKMKEVLQKKNKEAPQEVEDTSKEDEEIIPNRPKLVHVNPLAHLIGDKNIESLIPSNKYSKKPRAKSFENAIARALSKLDNKPTQNRKKRQNTRNDYE